MFSAILSIKFLSLLVLMDNKEKKVGSCSKSQRDTNEDLILKLKKMPFRYLENLLDPTTNKNDKLFSGKKRTA